MKNYKKGILSIAILLLIMGWVLAGWFFFKLSNQNNTPAFLNSVKKESSQEELTNNQIIITSQVAFMIPEIQQIVKSVDGFMNQYKLPKEVQNVYTISIVERKNDAIKIIIDPKEKDALYNNVLYARKTNAEWAVDANAGPWCASLKTFEENNCY